MSKGRRQSEGPSLVKTLALLLVSIAFAAVSGAEEPKALHADCGMCHKKGEERKAIKSRINETCLKCHPESKGKDHRVGIVAEVIPEKLPLGSGNIITCATCHDPHGKKGQGRLLRMDFNSLCKSCHKM